MVNEFIIKVVNIFVVTDKCKLEPGIFFGERSKMAALQGYLIA